MNWTCTMNSAGSQLHSVDTITAGNRPDIRAKEGDGMGTITIHEAQATLPDLIRRLAPGEALEITENGQPVAVVTASARRATVPGPACAPRILGTQAGSVLYMSPDFDAPLDEMKEYME
jgi:prevent-host-death family protein